MSLFFVRFFSNSRTAILVTMLYCSHVSPNWRSTLSRIFSPHCWAILVQSIDSWNLATSEKSDGLKRSHRYQLARTSLDMIERFGGQRTIIRPGLVQYDRICTHVAQDKAQQANISGHRLDSFGGTRETLTSILRRPGDSCGSPHLLPSRIPPATCPCEPSLRRSSFARI